MSEEKRSRSAVPSGAGPAHLGSSQRRPCADVGISRVHLNRKLKEFGAEWGVGVGMTSQCYAIPTMDGSIDIIRKHVDDFTAYAKAHPELTFLVTRIGCGIAGWRDSEIASLFKEASELDNVTLPEEFWNALGL